MKDGDLNDLGIAVIHISVLKNKFIELWDFGHSVPGTQ
jgi:hypothetical protein